MPSKYTILGGIVVLGAGAWTYRRLQCRKELADALASDPKVLEALELGVISWTPNSRAAELITPFNTVTVAEGVSIAAAEARAALPEVPALDLTADLDRVLDGKVTEVKEKAATLYDSLPDVPGIDTSNWLPAWVTGAEEPEA